MKNQAASQLSNTALIAIMVILAFGIPINAWIISSKFEAQCFNRLTGKNASTWEAMWVKLIVVPTFEPENKLRIRPGHDGKPTIITAPDNMKFEFKPLGFFAAEDYEKKELK